MAQSATHTDSSGRVLTVDGFPELYGQLTVSGNATVFSRPTPADSNLNNNADYFHVAGIWDALPHGVNRGIVQRTSSLLITRAGNYRVELWASVTSNQNLTNVGFKFSINDVISLVRRPRAKIGVASDRVNIAAYGFVALPLHAEVKLVAAVDRACDLTIEDCVFSLLEI